MIIATGRTFEHRDLLRSMGGRFDQTEKRWEFDRLSAGSLAKLKTLVGVFTAEVASAPRPIDDLVDTLSAILGVGQDGRTKRTGRCRIVGDDRTYHDHFADKNPAAFFGFSSLGRFVDYVANLPVDQRRTGWTSGGTSFHGTDTMREALDLARNGWSDGLDRAMATLERLAVDNPRVKRRHASLAGGTVSVGRMLAGNPAHMIRRPKQPGSRVVTLFVETGCSAYISTDSMTDRAAIIAATVDLMENAGYSCTIVAVDTSTDRGQAIYQLAVTLKEAGERLNLPDLIFALGHPSFLRRFSFAACSSVDECQSIWAHQGSASNAFDDEHRCGPTEFYVPVLRTNGDGLDLLPHVTPDRLPITIRSE